MSDVVKMVTDSGIAGFVIVAMGLFAIAVIVERAKYLFKEANLDADSFFEQVKSLIREDKIEEAISFCGANEKSPVGHVTKAILEKSDRDSRAMEEAQDVALSEVVPRLNKGLGYLTMIANVATLVGLLGTIHGLIMSFKAVAHADPGQKQTLLADGISMAMNTTALGLSVAIPVMIFYAFLHAKQGRVYEDLSRVTGKVLDEIKARDVVPFTEETIYSSNSKKDHNFTKSGSPTPPVKRAQ